MKRLYKWFAIFMIAAVLISACGRSATGNNEPANKFGTFGYQQALEFKQLYTDTYREETTVSTAFNIWWAFVENSYGQLKDMNFLSQNCYSNVKDILEKATIGIYDTQKSADGTPQNGILNQEQAFSALVTNNLYPANPEKCSEMMKSTLDQVVIIRKHSFEKQVDFLEKKRVLDNLYNDTLGKAAGKRFLDLYGQEFIAYANNLLVKNGVDAFPTDFIGFPTSGLSANTKSHDWYQLYFDIYTGVKPVQDPRFAKEMYLVVWNGPDNGGEATLYRQAAYVFMSRSFRSAGTENAVNCGDGAPGLSETVNSECTPVPNNPAIPTTNP